MTRLLEPIRPGLVGDPHGDDFLSRLAKFIPSEIGTLFTVVNAALSNERSQLPAIEKGSPEPALMFGITYYGWAWVVLVVCFLGNLFLLNRLYDKQFESDPLKSILKKKHIFASSIGFLVWAYAIKSPVFFDYYHLFAALLSIGIFLLVVKTIKPPLGT
jgi:hypothetical protein